MIIFESNIITIDYIVMLTWHMTYTASEKCIIGLNDKRKISFTLYMGFRVPLCIL